MTPVIRKEKFTVSLATKSYTYDVARFVVNQNIKHHTDCEDLGQHLRDIKRSIQKRHHMKIKLCMWPMIIKENLLAAYVSLNGMEISYCQ